ncbi:Endoplasmic reticulum junction formation protein lunapark [Lachnellula hyalina]|uniref:Endoplasmic reticulum junction formation protein lunapark n=1 Tax=Lachnellula hyalina TaxID=1316788 RepID=A0A8H8R2J9_9HELO|nr:Endoplasmic reticulum junction formation protein lunapark [Lachnellula hyalina]TVY25729.1 Endoplasmic reticulum junction formation protein lunapark [Lachnellula hyalina]
MVKFWPWKGEDNSPASFEKALSALAEKISKSQTQLDSIRQNHRRLKALWTLYASFAYLLCVIILFLVVGWKNWNYMEYTAIAGSPLFIYLIRQGINSYYKFRIDTATQRLEVQQAERAKTIDKLKAATKYNSTQELLEKYGGTPAPKPKKPKTSPKNPKVTQAQLQRTGTGPPPPTANIQRPGQNQIPTSSQPSTPQHVPNMSPQSNITPYPVSLPGQPGPPEFAPNAFTSQSQYAQSGELGAEGHWYDRVLDLLMGEDETSPKNRTALICQDCRLVNGQAPPGTKSLTDLGKWRCFGCGAWNGEEDDAVKAVKEMQEKIDQDHPTTNEGPSTDAVEGGKDSDGEDETSDAIEAEDIGSADDTMEVKPKRGRPKSTRKKA